MKSTIRTTLNCDVQTVWKVVTSPDDHAWRSDIIAVESSDRMHFTERSNGNILTRFTVTAFEPCRQYSLALDNDNLCGTWTGHFKQLDTGTEIKFTETISVKKWWLYPLAKWYLQKQQKRYVADLKRKCEQYE